MNEFYQKRILSIINRELAIDEKIRIDINVIIKLLTIEKQKNLKLSLETIQNNHFRTILSNIKSELCNSQIVDSDDSILIPFVQNRIDEILELNLNNVSEKERTEINHNLNTINKITNKIDKNNY
jgi:hypothetical protein